MNFIENFKHDKSKKLADKLIKSQENAKTKAYKIGYEGKKHPAFKTVGEDAELDDINRAITVHVLDLDNEASEARLNLAKKMLRPVLREYIKGLRDGCRDNGNDHIIDQGRAFRRKIADMNKQGGAI